MKEIYKAKNGDLLFRKSFCAYIDILGFSKNIEQNNLIYFNEYLKILNNELKHIEQMYDLSGKNGFKSFELKIFTDNFVFGHPWFDQFGESELGNIFEVLSHIQFTFIKSGIFIRGAITVSDLYMDDNIVLGPALVDAYNLESKKALNPRIILSGDVTQIVNKHIRYYRNKKNSPQNQQYLIDLDGIYFVNYLYILFYKTISPKERILKELNAHKEPIIQNLLTYESNFKLFEKYAWLASYHNSFCEEFVKTKFPKIDITSISIPEHLYKKNIKKII